MFSVEIKVNGSLVAGINAINTTGGWKSNYDFSGFQFPLTMDYRRHPTTFDGEVIGHNRSDGILKLLKLVLEQIE